MVFEWYLNAIFCISEWNLVTWPVTRLRVREEDEEVGEQEVEVLLREDVLLHPRAHGAECLDDVIVVLTTKTETFRETTFFAYTRCIFTR